MKKLIIIPSIVFWAFLLNAQTENPISTFSSVNPTSIPELSTIWPSVNQYLNQEGFSIQSAYSITLENQYSYWGIELTINGTNNSFALAIYPDTDSPGAFSKFLFQLENTQPDQLLSVIDIDTENNINSVVLTSQTGSTPTSGAVNCDETTNNFKDCMSCALEILTNDWVGWLACALNPVICVTASALHCTLDFDGNKD